MDPAQNLATLTQNNGIERYVGFFNSKTAKEIAESGGQRQPSQQPTHSLISLRFKTSSKGLR